MAIPPSAPFRRWQVRLPFRRPWSGSSFREATIIEGPFGFGEASPLPGFDCDPDQARRSAEEAALEGWPSAVRQQVAVNALIPPLAPEQAVALALEATAHGFNCLKVK